MTSKKIRDQQKSDMGTARRTAYVEIRSQSPKGSWPAQGPDTYVAVQIVPEGETHLSVLNRHVAANRGIEIVHCGEGYRSRTGPTSMLGKAKKEATELAASINNEN